MPRRLHEYSLYSLGHMGHPNQLFVTEKAFTHSELQDANPGWWQGHPKINNAGLIHMLNFVSGGLLTYFWHFWESSPVQSSDQRHPVLQMLVTNSFDFFPLYDKEPHLACFKAGLGAMESHPLQRMHFGQYQVSSAAIISITFEFENSWIQGTPK